MLTVCARIKQIKEIRSALIRGKYRASRKTSTRYKTLETATTVWKKNIFGKSEYEKDRIKRGAWSRLRKTYFTLEQILFIRIDMNTLKNSGSFQENFRNSDGSPRRAKVLIKLDELGKGIIKTIDYKK